MPTQMIIAFAFGVAFVVALLVLAIAFPRPTPFQYNVFRIVLALAAAGAAAMIPGFVNLELTTKVGLAVRAGGALAVFVMIYFFNPAQLAAKNPVNGRRREEGVENPLLSPVWDRMDPILQDAFAIAANQARRDGTNRLSTRLLFASLRRLNPDKLDEILRQLPHEALPEPTPNGIAADLQAINPQLAFSGCIQESLEKLSPNVKATQKLSSADIFIDIAKHGRGECVTRLRTHGVDANKIDQIVSQLGWCVIERS